MKLTFPQTSRMLVPAVLLTLASSVGCSRLRQADNEPAAPRVKWYAHCDTCNSCKGSYKTSQEAQEVVSNHNKETHDWYKVAYYHQGKCPPPQGPAGN